ncbi:putative leucine-rich repeat protein (LRRP) [Trypanosoma grayi]|uniref:putative leucine-rich repeat protein (LRRP) n=1 Tax=Trypanosoma grayi TaxID=71804 RepID=UPI0004F43A03|nr:putative leucine-rich repeat protein (LRRP) [Trypanosoma grayi]KEG09228.1 putative leucine-rich repeat protein (LRRP) [Trypanosoma grayi]
MNLSGCRGVKIVGALGRLPALRELNLRSTAITDEDLRCLSASRSLVKIDLGGCRCVTNESPLASIATLEEVNLSGCRGATSAAAFCTLPVLRSLDLQSTAISDEELRCLSASLHLVKINVAECGRLTDISPLALMETLEEVYLCECARVRSFGVLGTLPRLRVLDLSRTAITDEELRLLSASRSLVKIDLQDCEHLTDVSPLASVSTLVVMNLSGCRGVKIVGALGRLPALRELDLNGTSVTNWELEDLSASRSLVKIALSYCMYITDVSPLSSVQTLEEVDLSRCRYMMTVSVLSRLSRLRVLRLDADSFNGQLKSFRRSVRIHK